MYTVVAAGPDENILLNITYIYIYIYISSENTYIVQSCRRRFFLISKSIHVHLGFVKWRCQCDTISVIEYMALR